MTAMAAGSEHFPHAADVGVRGRGATPDEAFEGAARALFSLVAEDVSRIEPRVALPVSAGPAALDELLPGYLNELIYLFATRRIVFGGFEVRILAEGSGLYRLEGRALGEPYDASRHDGAVEPKGATYTDLRVGREDGGWVAQCVVDV
jgi:SHS2 domain-containing protein